MDRFKLIELIMQGKNRAEIAQEMRVSGERVLDCIREYYGLGFVPFVKAVKRYAESDPHITPEEISAKIIAWEVDCSEFVTMNYLQRKLHTALNMYLKNENYDEAEGVRYVAESLGFNVIYDGDGAIVKLPEADA